MSGSGDDALSLNGFRLSRHPVPNKELWWPEINAAWGQVRCCSGFLTPGGCQEANGVIRACRLFSCMPWGCGWGQVVLLVMSLSNLAGYSNAHYRLVFLGPASKLIQVRSTWKEQMAPCFFDGGGHQQTFPATPL